MVIADKGYGINHKNSTGSEINSFFGTEDKTGFTFLIISAVVAIAALFAKVKKK
jgi:hypothetical protein